MRRFLLLVLATLVLLVSAAPAHAALTVLDIATGTTWKLARTPSDGWTSLRWTPDGAALIGVENKELSLAVRRYPVDGGPVRTLRRLPDAFDAVLDHDGTMVAALYDQRHGLGATGGVLVRDVASGRTQLKLRQSAEGDDLYESSLDLVWSPDGGRVAYTAREPRRGETLRIADVRTGRVLRRLDAKRIGLAWTFSPSGDRLLYTSGNRSVLNVLDVATGTTRRLGTEVYSVAWAPAGERIATTTSDGGVTISGEDQRFQEVAHTEDLADIAAWSPDGTALALVVQGYNAGDKATLVIVPAGGGAPRTVAGPRFPGIFNVQWSPDGKRLAYDG